MTLVQPQELNIIFENKIKRLNTSFHETKAYILGIYSEHISKNIVISPKESITLKFLESNSFIDFQNLGDHILFSRTVYPTSLTAASDYYDSIAKQAYYKCHVLMDKKWLVFEELSDKFSEFVDAIAKQDHI
jgi:hypothetical protein